MNTPTRPALRYHGGKWNLAPWIISHFPIHKVYVEPFGGGASVLLRKPRSYAEVYNDLDAEIFNVFTQLRDNGPELKRLLTLTPFSRLEYEEAYEIAADPTEQARRTIIKSFMGFGSDATLRLSGFRANSNRSGTTPAHDWHSYADALDSLVSRLRGVVIECRDFEAVIKAHDSDDTLFYIDPPYVHATRTGAKRYNHEMPDNEHERLASLLHGVKGKVVLSGYPCDLYGALYATWNRSERSAYADGARKRTEILWTNFNIEVQSTFLFVAR